MRSSGHAVRALLTLVAAVTPLAAQTPADSAPRAVARAYSAALDRHDWDGAAALVDSTEVATFRRRQLTMILGAAAHRKELVRAMSSGSGGMASIFDDDTMNLAPPLVKYGAWRVGVITGSPTIAELAALPPRQLYARALASHGTLCGDGHCVFAPPTDTSKHRLIGVVIEDDTLAHLVYSDPEKRGMGAWGDKYAVSALHLVRRTGQWWLIPSGRPYTNFVSLLDDRRGLVAPPASATRKTPKH